MPETSALAVLAHGAGAALALGTLPGTLALATLTLASLRPGTLPGSRLRDAATPGLRLAVVVPAHDEEAQIPACVASLRASAGADPSCEIVVVADNCTDDTAAAARAAGARVLERHDPAHRGKGQALAFAFGRLLAEGFGAVLVVDADSVVDVHAVPEARRWLEAGADAVQLRYDVHAPDGSPLVRLRHLAFLGFNVVRLAGREAMGLSVGLLGNGFALSRSTLEAVPFEAGSVVEDLEYHLRLVEAGLRVRFARAARVYGEIPLQADAADAQAARWEGGRVPMLRAHAGSLFAALARGRLALLEPLGDLLLLPLGYQALLLAAAFVLGGGFARTLALVGVGVLILHVLVAAFVFGRGVRDLRALGAVPGLLVRKLLRLPAVAGAARPGAEWVRTERATAPLALAPSGPDAPDASIVIVSFNTRLALRRCLESVPRATEGASVEIVVVDNASRDGSADMVEREFPAVTLLRSGVNLGFAAANNLAFRHCRGRFVILLNSDAFPEPGAVAHAIKRLEADPAVGLAGGRLVGLDGSWQPSARSFPSPLQDLVVVSGLAARHPRSRFFGRFDRTYADPMQDADVDWVPGAFAILRREALAQAGGFDERFFLYYEEVDLCRRLAQAGWRIAYWPDVLVRHVGGASSRKVETLTFAQHGSQLTLWRMRSQLLYYRKHDGLLAAAATRLQESCWHALRALRNSRRSDVESQAKAADSRGVIRTWTQAWNDTDGGRSSPPRPW